MVGRGKERKGKERKGEEGRSEGMGQSTEKERRKERRGREGIGKVRDKERKRIHAAQDMGLVIVIIADYDYMNYTFSSDSLLHAIFITLITSLRPSFALPLFSFVNGFSLRSNLTRHRLGNASIRE